MRTFDMNSLPQPDAYRMLINVIQPRPIAWVSTVSKNGVANLAPYSFFTGAGSNPPSVVFCPATTPELKEKDTLVNIRQSGEFVVNIVTQDLLDAMNQTAAPYDPDTSEFEAAGLTPVPCVKVNVPRVAQSPIALECKLIQVVDIGQPAPGSGHVVIGQVVYAHLSEDVCDETLHVDIAKLKAVGRLAGSNYTFVDNVVTRPRPTTG